MLFTGNDCRMQANEHLWKSINCEVEEDEREMVNSEMLCAVLMTLLGGLYEA